ncbi:radical SAM protein [Solidesulfovibrio sp.]|uniref:radical SAM protein n=1 Tax=Solidesulfovibrio sp. TaxID=2910990 RepID=UPI0026111D6D|nr:radical SAM protein [Solidesulfovibrio sp.]
MRNTSDLNRQRKFREVRQKSIPVISLGVTDQCNLSCFMCGIAKKYENTNRKRQADRLPLEYCREFAEHHFAKAQIVNSNCYGELFLYPRLKAYLQLLKQYRPARYTTTTTSGSLRVPEKLWRDVLESHDEILFSIDSIDRTIHRIIRGFDYAIADKNIRTVQRLAATDYPKFKHGCSVVLMKLTIATLFDTLKASHEEYGCRLFHFQHIADTPAQSLATEKQWRVLFNDVLLKCREYMKRHGITSNGDIGLYRDAAGNLES